MSSVWPWLAVVPIAYLIGAIPIGLIVGRIFGGVDVRTHGSGSAGAANVARAAGWKVGALVVGLDIGKGLLAIVLARIIGDSNAIEAVAGSSVVLGHNWPVFAGFRGGKGVSTALGSMVMISPYAALATSPGLLVMGGTRYISLGSLIGAGLGAVVLMVQLLFLDYAGLGYMIFPITVTTLIVWRHRSNIRRLARGEERKFGTQVAVKRTVLRQQ